MDSNQDCGMNMGGGIGFVKKVGYFLWHFIEMCLVMCIGGISLNAVFFLGVAQLGYPDLMERFPELSLFIVGILLAIPMIVWMRFRSHDWQSTLEMSLTSIILAVLIITAASLSFISKSGMLEWMKGLACMVMLIPMLLRFNMYSGSHANHQMHAH